MKGWHRDNYRHSLAARRISTASKRWPSSNVFVVPRPYATPDTGVVLTNPGYEDLTAAELMQLDFDTYDNEKFKKREQMAYKNPLSDSITQSFNEWIFKPKTAKYECDEKLIGGLGDCMPDEEFAEPLLSEGITVEMEHTNDPDIAKEISKDHIVEHGMFQEGKLNSDYYKRLEEMENEL